VETRSAIVFNLADSGTKPLRWDRGFQRLMFGEHNGARNVDVHINVIKVGSGTGPYHYHERAENVYIVLEGIVEAVVEGKRYFLQKDDVAFIPPGLRHYAGNPGQEPAKVIEIYAPAGQDFHIVDDPTDIEEVVACPPGATPLSPGTGMPTAPAREG
jgi:mannose-6-phosphate isomerase-like protein (cupin superfamily)